MSLRENAQAPASVVEMRTPFFRSIDFMELPEI